MVVWRLARSFWTLAGLADCPKPRPKPRCRPGLDPGPRFIFRDAVKAVGPRIKPGVTMGLVAIWAEISMLDGRFDPRQRYRLPAPDAGLG